MTVVDASAMVDALVGAGPHGDRARAALRRLDLLQAPAVFHAEVTAALRSLVMADALAPARAWAAAGQVSNVQVQEYPFAPFLERIWERRDNLTPYDAWYVAIAEQLGEPLLTADARLARAPGLRCEVVLTHKPSPPSRG